MLVRTVRDLGALVHDARMRRGMTQAGLARTIGVSRDWIVRLEQGGSRLHAQLVLDALSAAGLAISVELPETDTSEDNQIFDNLLQGLVNGDQDG